jgi:hypothetical protein
MVSGMDAVLIAFGIIACFMGYSMFQSLLPAWGFVLGGWFAYIMLPRLIPAHADELLYQVVALVGGGLVGAILAIPLYYVIVFLSGAALGVIAGTMIGALIDVGGVSTPHQLMTFTTMSFPPFPQSGTQMLISIVLAVVLGGLAINFQKFMICASSAFIGAGALISGLTGTIFTMSATDVGRSAIMLMSWMILGCIGLFVQFRMMGEV